MPKKTGLGKGLDALFSDNSYTFENDSKNDTADIKYVRLSDVEPDKNQPRKDFDEEALNSLCESIKTHGVLQPLVVRRAKTESQNAASKLLEEKYTIISGERRWRASNMAGLHEIPVVIKDISDTDVAAIMLVENLQREDLNPIELARGLKRLIDEYGLTQEKTAEIVGISRPALTNSLRLLTLPEEVISTILSGDITQGHARALLGLGNEDLIVSVLQVVVRNDLSVRETENLVKNTLNQNKAKKVKQEALFTKKRIYLDTLEDKISSKLGRKTFIHDVKKNTNKGKLEIEYYGNEDLEALLKLLCGDDIFSES